MKGNGKMTSSMVMALNKILMVQLTKESSNKGRKTGKVNTRM